MFDESDDDHEAYFAKQEQTIARHDAMTHFAARMSTFDSLEPEVRTKWKAEHTRLVKTGKVMREILELQRANASTGEVIEKMNELMAFMTEEGEMAIPAGAVVGGGNRGLPN